MNGMPFRLRALVHSSDERSSTKAYLLFTRQVTTGLPGPVVRFTCCFLVSTKRARRERTRRRHVVSEINAHTTVGQRMRALRAKTRYERDLAEVIVPGQTRRLPVCLSVCLSVCLPTPSHHGVPVVHVDSRPISYRVPTPRQNSA